MDIAVRTVSGHAQGHAYRQQCSRAMDLHKLISTNQLISIVSSSKEYFNKHISSAPQRFRLCGWSVGIWAGMQRCGSLMCISIQVGYDYSGNLAASITFLFGSLDHSPHFHRPIFYRPSNREIPSEIDVYVQAPYRRT